MGRTLEPREREFLWLGEDTVAYNATRQGQWVIEVKCPADVWAVQLHQQLEHQFHCAIHLPEHEADGGYYILVIPLPSGITICQAQLRAAYIDSRHFCSSPSVMIASAPTG
ncbi:MAG: hypothetical protein COT71_01505 [Candidatus Andersenbacteria bacterium CG10_big_fil_rev_8_21_14_0_10_54_11]|uniref:Uncharacterized protein n=1 Tax=Candidatus Andersenbacteria bacterium CG10_big_fil_rev_8_21_14_0_10_54_11 TaxID=1974485 RepID=A0A2M6WZQ5_9BACT|nr:MAG: hypothetical protein COT71_01505 [Candidatus Andersenbacteria bacterium CG10_big_fil_rev_8_21_14_0_10_54_11]